MSTAAPLGTGPVDPAATAVAATAALNTGTGTSSPTGGAPPPTGDVIVLQQNFISDTAWPADLKLDRLKANWVDWDRRLNLVVDQRHFSEYLDGTFPCPDTTDHPKAARNWRSNNRALRAFILEHVSNFDYGIASVHLDAHDVYQTLRHNHEFLGLHVQVLIIKEALSTRFNTSTPLLKTLDDIDKLHSRFVKMGKMDDDKLKIILIVNALADHYHGLQSTITTMLQNPAVTSEDVKKRILMEEEILSSRGSVETTALSAVTSRNNRPICSNCKRPNHRTEYCIAAGGQMAGKTIDDARAAQDAARIKAGLPVRPRGGQKSSSQNNAPAAEPAKANSITVNGKCYMLVSEPTATADANSALTAVSMAAYDEEEYITCMAITDSPHISLDWQAHARLTDTVPSAAFTTPAAYTTGRSQIARAEELPFILDTGTTCHITPEASDFKNLKSILRHAVKGLGGSAVYAIGTGDVELHIANGHTLKLMNVLYIPESSVRLISILALNQSGSYTTHFDSVGCWVTNKSNTVLIRGTLSVSKRLYVLTTKTPSVQHKKKDTTPTALASTAFYARVPDLETWHRRLGHCNPRTIIDMAKGGISQGMPIDLSSLPPSCEHCALGKQSRSPVPKKREGSKADKRLGRVFVDLCRPMAVTSRSGKVYSMNVIDDYSGYVWSVPLRTKADACNAIQNWHKAVTVQTGDKLRILVTDNGELVSKSMQEWCEKEGIDHQRTAPYTSAQNGRAERLHRTIIGKARAMRFACNAPAILWDEFCATAAYLTTLTAAKANNGRTPYELWFDHKPSLSHLREIGCRAFSLIHPTPSKIYARSSPSILIGYAPHSKAYRLWDPSTSHVFNSYHVTFTEHLNAEPSPLLPGTVLGTTGNPLPPSWDAPGPAPPSNPPDPNPHPFSIYSDPSPTCVTDDPPLPSQISPFISHSSLQNTHNRSLDITIPRSDITIPPDGQNNNALHDTVPSDNNANNTVPLHTRNHNATDNDYNNAAPPPCPFTITIPPRPPLRDTSLRASLSALASTTTKLLPLLRGLNPSDHYSTLLPASTGISSSSTSKPPSSTAYCPPTKVCSWNNHRVSRLPARKTGSCA
jgi:transposase InsO family protein